MTQETDLESQSIFSGRFRVLYLAVKAIAYYTTAFLIFFYWPQFLGKILFPDYGSQLQVISGVLLAPLGFLVVGLFYGKRVLGIHILVLVGVAATIKLFWPADAPFTPLELYDRALPVIIVGYLICIPLGLKADLYRSPPVLT